MPLLFLLFIWFFAEIATFIAIGEDIGAGIVILEIIFSAIIGGWLIRKTIAQGMLAMMTMGGGGFVSVVLGGILLIIPGFITDGLGILALLPGTLSVVLTILGLGRKVDMDSFVKNRMGSMGGMGGFSNMGNGKDSFGQGNPFGDGQNPFSGQKTQQQKPNSTQKKSTKPLNGDIIDGDVIRKFEKKD